MNTAREIKRKRKFKFCPAILARNIFLIISVITFIWIAVSYAQVVIHNDDYIDYGIHYQYPEWNAFMLMTDLGEVIY